MVTFATMAQAKLFVRNLGDEVNADNELMGANLAVTPTSNLLKVSSQRRFPRSAGKFSAHCWTEARQLERRPQRVKSAEAHRHSTRW